MRYWCLSASLACACAWTPSTGHPSESSEAPPPSVEPIASNSAERSGSGWRVRAGVLETLHEGVRVQRSVGWRLVLGSALGESAAYSSFRLRHVEDSIVVRFEPAYFEPNEDEQRWRELFDRNWHAQWTPVVFTANFAGREIEFAQFESEGPQVGRLYRARVEINRRAADVLVMTEFELETDLLTDRVNDALSGVEVLTAAELDRLRTELARVPPNHDLLRKDRSLRGDHFHHFGYGVAVRLPRGFWLVSTTEQPLPSLLLSRPSEKLQVSLNLIPSDHPSLSPEDRNVLELEQRHENALRTMIAAGMQRRDSKRRELGAIVALVERLEIAGSPRRLHFVSVVHDDIHVVFMIHSRLDTERRDDAQVEALIDELLTGLELGASQMPFEQLGQRFFDRRSGFSITVPSVTDPELVEVNEELSYGYSATWGPARVHIMNAGAFEEEDEEMLDVFVETISWGITVPGLVQAPTSERTVAGHRARWLRWEGVDGFEFQAVCFIRDRTLFSISHGGGDREAFDQLLDSFEFIDCESC